MMTSKKHNFKWRAFVAWFMVLIFIGILIGRLVYLEVVEVERFTTLSKNNWLKIVPIPPPRGLIFDRNGITLAENEVSYSLEIQPERVDDLEELLQRLRKLIELTDKDIARFKKLKARAQRFKPVVLKNQLNETEVAIVSVHSYELTGARITPNLTRVYPMGEVGAHAVGYVGRINEKEAKSLDEAQYDGTQYIGKTGIEKHYENQLHGEIGYQEVEVNVAGQILRVVKQVDPIPGDNLYLNLDIVLQKKAEELFAREDEKGALVAIDPATGGVLALVSSPSYDPNLFVKGIDSATYQELNDEDERPLYNRAVNGVYPPGSTIKPFVGLAGLDYGLRRFHDQTWCPGWFTLGDDEHKYRDWKRNGHGYVDLYHAIEQSCDVYFYDLAEDLGIDRLSSFMRQFGFGEKTGIDTFGEVSGLLPTREWKRRRHHAPWYPGETLIAGIGQGYVLATPLQLASATATLSMKGESHLPRMVFAMESGNAQHEMALISSQAPTRVNVRNPEYWDNIIKSMEAVIDGSEGTANKLSDNLKYRMAGKTGTAQVVQIKQNQTYDATTLDKEFQDHALFISFAPVEDPKIAIAIIIENGGSGGRTAAPYAKEITDFYLFDRLGITYEEIK